MMKCFCTGSRNPKKLKCDLTFKDRILPCEKELLKLIFQNLASRCQQNKLNQHNFMLFFPLTGLWGEKVFKFFASGQSHLLSFSQFYIGINKMTRGNFQEKTAILFNLIKQPHHRGIRYRQFLKMLYHYSKKQLKQIMASDGVFVHQSILPSNFLLSGVSRESLELSHEQHERNQEENHKSSFERAYQEIIQENGRDEKTSIILEVASRKYLVNHINLKSLTEQFASHVFNKYNIDKNGQMMEKQFRNWVLGNNKFFETFLAAFHENLWGYSLQLPNFLQYIEKEADIKYCEDDQIHDLHIILAKNMLFLSLSKERRDSVYRIICLDGVTVNIQSELTMEIKDVPNNLTKCQLKFSNDSELYQWLNLLSTFSKNYIHSKYQIGEAIATGRFSVVYKCFERKCRTPCALKVINLKKLQPYEKSAIEVETEILKIIKSPDFVKHFETIYSKENIYIVMEYVFGEDLFQYVRHKKRLSEYESAYIVGKIIQAVMQLHSLEIIHRDLKPENIMIEYHRETLSQSDEQLSPRKFSKPDFQSLKIIDFGYASYSSMFDSLENVPVVGTPNYIAPEILNKSKPSFQNDIFAIGSILYFMLSGQFAFYSHSMAETMARTKMGDYTMCGGIWEQISEQAKDLIEKMLEVDPERRITLRESLNHPWFSYLNPKKKTYRKQSTDHE